MYMVSPRAFTKKISSKNDERIIKGIKMLLWKMFALCKRKQ